MPTAAALVGGTIVSGLIGAEGTRQAGRRGERGAREAGAISAEGFREAGDIEAGAFRQFANIEREVGGITEAERRASAESFRPFAAGGAEAAQLEAALSGALGPEAQQQAIDAQVDSPFTQFIEQRGRAQIGQGFASGGGLGGGERLRALTEFGQGVATQSLSTQLQNLRNVRQGGFNATANIADLMAQASGARAGGVRGEGLALLNAAGAEAGGIRGAGGARANAITGATGARAQGGFGVSQAAGQGVADISTILALQNQGLFNRPGQV